jgi:hypothetical protein
MRKRMRACGHDRFSGRPYSVLLPAGFAVAHAVTSVAVRSYRTLSPLLFFSGLSHFVLLETATAMA